MAASTGSVWQPDIVVVQTSGGTAPDAAAVRLRLLGAFRLSVDGEDRSAALPTRAPSLLACLVLRRDAPQARQRVARLLWPESTDGQARTNLRNVLHHLRRSAPWLAPLLEIGPGALRWVGGPQCSVDALEFIHAMAAAGEAQPDSPAECAALREAVRWYEGDLLEDCPDECLAEDRVRLHEQLLTSLRRLASVLSRGDAVAGAEAVLHCRELVRRDPLNEEHHRLLIQAHRAAGDRAGAVRAFHDCVAILRQELDVAPAAATREVYDRLIHETTDQAGAIGHGRGSTGGAESRGATPFVGRAAELAALRRLWRQAVAGVPGLVVVTGEAGVGKTRLVEEFALRCGREGALAVSARCYTGEGELGYGAVIDWLRSPEIGAALRGVSPADRRQLARLMPELAPDASAASPARAMEMDRILLFDAIVRVLTDSGRPVLLMLDDVHWCDQPSLQLVHYLARGRVDRSALVVATARGDELDDAHPLTAVQRQLAVVERASWLELARLSLDETAELAEALAGVHIDEAGQRRLHAQTEGNPLFVVEAFRAGWNGEGDMKLTPKLQSVIAGRLGRLSEGARELVSAAAAIGRAFTADLLGRMVARDELAVVRGLDELWRRGVIVSHGVHEYDFSHGRIRDAALDALTPVARQGWRLAAARALAALPSHEVDAHSGQIAAHFDRAGQVAEAIDWYERAVTQALRRGAHAEAYGLLQRAMVLARGLPDGAGPRRELDLLAMAPPVLGGVDGYASDRLTGYQRRAREIAGRLGAPVPAALLRSSIMEDLCRDEFERAAGDAAKLLETAQRSGDQGLVVESRYLMAIAAFWSGNLGTAVTLFRQVVDEVDETGRAEHLVRFGQDPQVVCLSRLANAHFFRGDLVAARSTVDDALALAQRVGDPYTRDVAHIFAAVLAADLRDPALLSRAVAVFRDGRPEGIVTLKSEALLGYADVVAGRAAYGIERIERSIRACGNRNPAPSFLPTLYRMLVGAYELAGDPDGGLAAADRALALGGTRLWEAEIQRMRARWQAMLKPAASQTGQKRSTNAAPRRLRA